MYKINRDKIRASEAWADHILTPEYDGLKNFSREHFKSMYFLFLFMLLIFTIYFGRILFLNFGMDNYFFNRAESNYKRVLKEQPLRGIIYDRNGVQLVKNIAINNLVIIPADFVRDETKRLSVFTKLANILSINKEEIDSIFEKNKYSFTPTSIKRDITHAELVAVETNFYDEASVYVKRGFNRDYMYSNTYSHILGYLGKVTEDEYKSENYDFERDSLIGRMGIESQYDEKLRGASGEKTIYINALGKIISEISRNQSVPGENIVLTIDHELQEATYTALSRAMERGSGQGGSAVVLDPNNGEILAMVSLPDFDPNIFRDVFTDEAWNELIEDNRYPFLNRTISGNYPPGSVFKMVTAEGVLREEIVSPEDKINSPGTIRIEDMYNPDKVYIYKDWKLDGHGELTIKDALAVSSDTFMYTVTGGLGEFKGLGIRRLIDHCKKFMVGQKLGIDLPGESGGLLPTPDWKISNRGMTWFTGDTYNMSIGQGYLLATPLQVAQITSIVASGGIKNVPHLKSGNSTMISSDEFLEDNLNVIKEGLEMVIYSDRGTGRILRNFEPKIAGKTGTAQFETGKKEHAWFTAYGPAEKPEIVVTVLVEESGEGGEFALPVVREILNYYFNS